MILPSGGRAGVYGQEWIKAGYNLDQIEQLRQELLSRNDYGQVQRPLQNDDFAEFVQDMIGENVSLRAAGLQVLWERPAADERILPYLEYLLHDKSPCLLAIPYRFGVITRSGWLLKHWRQNERR